MVFFSIILVESKEILTIPMSWCHGIDVVRALNYGLKNLKNKLIFFSHDENAEPNFCLPVRMDFSSNEDACYIANILKIKGSRAESTTYNEMRRRQLPKDYAGNAKHEDLDELQHNFIDAQQQIPVKQEPFEIEAGRFNDQPILVLDDSIIGEGENDADGFIGNEPTLQNLAIGDELHQQNDADVTPDASEIDPLNFDDLNDSNESNAVGNENAAVRSDECAPDTANQTTDAVQSNDTTNGTNKKSGDVPTIDLVGGGGNFEAESAVVMPRPWSVKKEDPLSNDIQYLLLVKTQSFFYLLLRKLISFNFCVQDNMDRFYVESKVTIRESVADTLILWNTMESYQNEHSDFIFLQFLLIDIFGGEILATGFLDERKLQFVDELFSIRVKSDQARKSMFKAHVTNLVQQFVDKNELI